ncbi:MAG: hypothetical protein WDN69_00860 [Aliidongia sp.]
METETSRCVRKILCPAPTKALPALAALLWCLAGPVQAAAPPWPETPYPYVMVDQDLVDVLTEFGQTMKTPVQISDSVRGHVLGRIPPLPPRVFLDRLATQFGFNWYYDGSTLAIAANSELVQRTVPLGKTSFDALNAELDRLGINDSRYKLRHAEGSDLVVVAGPPRYAELVEQTVTALNKEHAPTVKIYLGDEPQTPAKPSAEGTSGSQD